MIQGGVQQFVQPGNARLARTGKNIQDSMGICPLYCSNRGCCTNNVTQHTGSENQYFSGMTVDFVQNMPAASQGSRTGMEQKPDDQQLQEFDWCYFPVLCSERIQDDSSGFKIGGIAWPRRINCLAVAARKHQQSKSRLAQPGSCQDETGSGTFVNPATSCLRADNPKRQMSPETVPY